MTATRRIRAFGPGLLATAFGLASALSAQEPGVLSGVLVDDADGRPVVGATVSLTSLGLAASTNETGYFALEGVRIGDATIRFEAPGYVAVTEEVDISGVEFVQVRLVALGAALDELVVIVARASGTEHTSELDVPRDATPSASVLDVLAAQVPGLQVHRGGGVLGGGGTAIRIRGIGTFQGNAAPEVYLDGVRLDGRDSGEHSMHILETIPASEVARIRVHKGAAGSPYGFSANGVIVIETHRGGGGPGRG